MHRLTFIAIVFTPSLACAGEVRLPGFDSPESAFHAYVTGAITEDFDLMLSALTPESKAYHIGISIYSAMFLFGEDPAMQKVLLDHVPELGFESDQPLANEDEALVAAMLKIKDPGKLMKKIAERHEQLAQRLAADENSRAETKSPTKTELLKLILGVTLENLQVAENSATASVKLPAPVKETISHMQDSVQFRRIENRWYCDIDPR